MQNNWFSCYSIGDAHKTIWIAISVYWEMVMLQPSIEDEKKREKRVWKRRKEAKLVNYALRATNSPNHKAKIIGFTIKLPTTKKRLQVNVSFCVL